MFWTFSDELYRIEVQLLDFFWWVIKDWDAYLDFLQLIIKDWGPKIYSTPIPHYSGLISIDFEIFSNDFNWLIAKIR